MKLANEHCTDVETWAEALFLAHLEYELRLGTEFEVSYVTVYRDDQTYDIAGPIRIRLERTAASDLNHRNDEYLDPYWDLTILDLDESVWTLGRSYRVLESARERLLEAA